MNRSFGDRVLVLGACWFGSWTVFCYVMVISESSFSDLKMWSFVPFVIGLIIGSLCISKFVTAKPALVEELNHVAFKTRAVIRGSSGRYLY